MDTATAAAQAHVTVATVRTWCRRGVVAAAKQAGRWVIDAASLNHRIAIGKLKNREENVMPQPPEAPWDSDHPEAATLDRLVAFGVTPARIVQLLGPDASDLERPRRFTGRTRRIIDNLLVDQELAAEDAARAAAPRLATPSQVNYILALLASRARSGEGGGFFHGPTDRAGIERLSRADASSYIDSLKGDY